MTPMSSQQARGRRSVDLYDLSDGAGVFAHRCDGCPLISPILPDLRSVFEISDAQIGLVITAYTLPACF